MVKSNNNWLYITKDTDLDANCRSVFFLNLGNSIATIHGVPIPPYGWIKFEGDPDELDQTTYKVEFSGGSTNRIYCLKKQTRQIS